MSRRSVITQKKKRGPAPTGKGTLIGVRLLPELLGPLDAWIAAQPEPRPTRPEAIRGALEDWLNERKPLAPAALDEKIEALADAAASLDVAGGPSPRKAMNQLKKALVENEKTKLENKRRKIVRKADKP